MAASGNHEAKDAEPANGASGVAPSEPLLAQAIGVDSILGHRLAVEALEVPDIVAESIHAPALQAPPIDAPRVEVAPMEVAECVVEPVCSAEIQAAQRPEISRWRRPLRKNERVGSVFSLPILLGRLRSLWWWWAVALVVSALDGWH